MSAYYNEIDPFAAEWLRNLIAAGHIAPGEVDERSIAEVAPDDLRQFKQVHFFAGIGGWSFALRLAGWPDDRPVWTGSCPCQPFSSAGKRGGVADERHLWPEMFRLVAALRPVTVMGEQVASRDGLGWLDAVSDDLEGAGYACGALDLCAAGVGAPHIRQRLWWRAERLADCDDAGLPLGGSNRRVQHQAVESPERQAALSDGDAGRLALPHGRERDGRAGSEQGDERDGAAAGRVEGNGGAAGRGRAGGVADAECAGIRPCGPGGVGEATGGLQGANGERQWIWPDAGAVHDDVGARPGPLHGFWRDADWLGCRDGKWRPVEPGSFPLADGLPGRVGRLRAYGNAIVPQVAAAFIRASKPVEGVASETAA